MPKAKKDFKAHNPNSKLITDSNVETEQIGVNEIEKPVKRKPGRPRTKTEPVRNINIAVPVSVLDKLETVKPCVGGNVTAYINRLIAKDLEENYEKYMEVVKMF